ncbi:hypothetical protein NIES4071_104100 (plasmid) [Calothrix sp. NIES-4071]|nr:hypothetical protein NIES4071_104100 [Calothrix sp. NIES-4071]BAZ64397.1 hypothetical protein NIES4105_101300 [Calothrix sp. NIES-4105]
MVYFNRLTLKNDTVMIKTFFDQTINKRCHAFFCDACGQIINNSGGCVLYKREDSPCEVRHTHNVEKCLRQIENKNGYDLSMPLENHVVYLAINSGFDLTELAERDKAGYFSI